MNKTSKEIKVLEDRAIDAAVYEELLRGWLFVWDMVEEWILSDLEHEAVEKLAKMTREQLRME